MTAFIGTLVVIGTVALWPGSGDTGPVSPSQPTTTIGTETPVGPSIQEYQLLDGRIATVELDPPLALRGYSFFITAPEVGGERHVTVTLGDPSDLAASGTAEEEAKLSDTTTLWRADREGQPLFLSVDLGSWVVWLNVGDESNRPSDDALLQLAQQLTGSGDERGVVLDSIALPYYELHLSGSQDELVTLRIGTCFNESVPSSETVEDPRWGQVIRSEQRAAWCIGDGELEVEADGPETFVDSTVGSIDIRINDAPPTTDSSSPVVRWSKPGVGMIDAFFPDNRLLAANDRIVFVADGWGDFGNGPRTLSALSATTGEVIWQRTDLTSPSDGLFIQLLTSDLLVVNGQDRTLAAVDSVTGATIWAFNLPEGYNASGAVSSGDVMYIGAHATNEGNIEPPIAYGIDLGDGSVIWESSLAEGTDLQPVAPALSNEAVLFSSTLSHPGSAQGNMIHAVSTDDGSTLWELNLGGEQGFKFFPTLIQGDVAIVSGPTEMHGVSMIDGTSLWVVPGAQPLAQANDGRAIGWVEQGIAEFDWETGRQTMIAEVDWAQGVYRPNGGVIVGGQLVVSDGRNLLAYSLGDGLLQWTWSAPGVIVDSPIAVGEAIAVPVGNQDDDPPDQRFVTVLVAP
ncbi:MAG TPA: PQQ-binding-like beta-propeller repeat protein [Acidimicrobiia bacterium]|nr:PQQ-binding-like beta-propeller repeat protein [Acidimicrobiia bacterium]